MMFKLDSTAFKAYTTTEAAKMNADYYRSISWQKKLRIADYLNSIVFYYTVGSPPKIDKTKFVVRGRK